MATSLVTPFINPEDEEQLRGSRIARLLAGSSAPPMPPSNVPVNPMSAGQNPAVMASMAQAVRPQSLAELGPPPEVPNPQPYLDQRNQYIDKIKNESQPLDRSKYRPGIGRTLGAILLGALAGPRGAESIGENVLWGKYNRAEKARSAGLQTDEKLLGELDKNQGVMDKYQGDLTSRYNATRNYFKEDINESRIDTNTVEADPDKPGEFRAYAKDDTKREHPLPFTPKGYQKPNAQTPYEKRKAELAQMKKDGMKFTPKEERDYLAMGEGALKKDDFPNPGHTKSEHELRVDAWTKEHGHAPRTVAEVNEALSSKGKKDYRVQLSNAEKDKTSAYARQEQRFKAQRDKIDLSTDDGKQQLADLEQWHEQQKGQIDESFQQRVGTLTQEGAGEPASEEAAVATHPAGKSAKSAPQRTADPQKSAPANSAAPKSGDVRTYQGHPYQYDGKQWVLQRQLAQQ